jgi:ABC-type cobalamin transport system ATPase subunit
MSNNSYHYFARHQTNNAIINRLQAVADYENLEDAIQEKIAQLAKGYYARDKILSIEEYCLKLIESNKELLEELMN